MSLDPETIQRITLDCCPDIAPGQTFLTIRGIVRHYRFDPAAIERHADEIRDLLRELPDAFQQGATGDGWSFLNACQDRRGNQWTGEHVVMEALLCLGLAAGWARWTMPRWLWDNLPGGMPYFTVLRERGTVQPDA